MIYFLNGFVIGCLIGFIFWFITIRVKTSTGALHILETDDKDTYKITIDKFDSLKNSKRVWLRVEQDNELDNDSQ